MNLNINVSRFNQQSGIFWILLGKKSQISPQFIINLLLFFQLKQQFARPSFRRCPLKTANNMLLCWRQCPTCSVCTVRAKHTTAGDRCIPQAHLCWNSKNKFGCLENIGNVEVQHNMFNFISHFRVKKIISGPWCSLVEFGIFRRHSGV